MNGELAAMTWTEASGGREAILAVPVGATEQHGPHLPLATDTVVATALATRLSAARPQVVAAPAVGYGSSGEHADFPGTVSIGADVTRRLLIELGRSASATFGRLLFINAHGGNLEPLEAAVATLIAEGRTVLSFTPNWGGDAHAGEVETSLMLAIAPQWVALSRAEAGVSTPLGELLPRLRRHGVRAVSANGVLGDPVAASAAAGERLLNRAVAALADRVDTWERDVDDRPADTVAPERAG